MSPTRPPQHALADRAVNAFERHLLDLGWVWNPTRSGSDYGIDGFVTPTDDAGQVLSFEIPIQVKGVGKLERRGALAVAHPVTREAVDILRTHILGGYFMVYDDEAGELFYCRADTLGAQFDSKGGKRKRLRFPLENVVSSESLRALRNDAETAHSRLVAAISHHGLSEAAQRLYLALAQVQHALFEFVAAIGLFDEGNLMRIYASWAQGVARERQTSDSASDFDDTVDNFLGGTSKILSEYEVEPPTYLLSNFPAASLMLSSMQWIIQEIDEFVTSLEAENRHVAEGLGLAGLRSIVRAALDRSFSTPDGARPPMPDGNPRVYSISVHSGHYFLSTAQVALVVNRLMYELREVVFPSHGSDVHPPPRVWIWHRSDEEAFVRPTNDPRRTVM